MNPLHDEHPRGELRAPAPATRGVGDVHVGRGVAWLLCGVFVGLIVLVPLLDQTVGALRRAAKGETPLPPVADLASMWPRLPMIEGTLRKDPSWRGVRDLNLYLVRAHDRFTTGLEDASALSAWLTPPLRRLISGTLHGGSEDVFVGWRGWLYYRPDIEYLTGPGFLSAAVQARRSGHGDPVAAIVQCRDELAARGIALLVVPTPVKPMIYPEQFALRYGAEAQLEQPDYAAFAAQLAAASVAVCDLRPAMAEAKQQRPGEPLYLATDTHWTPAGLAVATRAIAATLGAHGWAQPAAAQAPRSDKTVANTGDLARMLEFPGAVRLHDPETVSLPAFEAPPGGPAEVLLLGDSFSNIYSLAGMGWGTGAGLAESLAAQIGAPVEPVCVNGDGAFASRLALRLDLLRGQDRLAGKKVVVWQFAARELTHGDWRTDIPLTPRVAAKRGPGLSTPQQVRGRIAAMTTPPAPGKTPYDTAVIALHLEQVVRTDTDAPQPDRLVYLWGMRENAWTDALRWRVGGEVSLVLLPWKEVERFVGRHWRVELEDAAAAGLEAWWAITQPGMAEMLQEFTR
jgi:alginate O-acetyltransferase complex protein AlgJ